MIISKFEYRKEELTALSNIAAYLNQQIKNEQEYEMYHPIVNTDTNTIGELSDWEIEQNERATARINVYQDILVRIEKMV